MKILRFFHASVLEKGKIGSMMHERAFEALNII